MLPQANIKCIPNYVSAPSPQRLRALMYMVQSKLGVIFSDKNIVFANGRWYCWFQHEIEEHELKDLLSGKIDKKKEREGGV